MKNIRFLTLVLILGTLVLSACGAAAATATPDAAASGKVEAMPVAFIGIVDSIAGDQWVISGTTVTVTESVVRDGPFNVGDRVKVEGLVNPDGSFSVSRVEAPTPQDAATLTPFAADNTNETLDNANTNDANINDDNSNDGNSNDGNINDDDSNINDDNGNDDNSNDSNINDDNGNDDNSNDSNSNDDSGGNSNDDSSNNNDNDDDSGGNSGKGGDDSGGKGGGGGDDDGGDDHGDGGNSNDD